MKPTLLITGASSGIGFSTALYFLEKGYQVLAHGRTPEKLKPLLDKANASGDMIPIYADLENENEIHNMFKSLPNQIQSIDVMINNAGWEGVLSPYEKTDLEVLDKVYRVNVRSVFQCIQLATPYLKKGSHIINISSIGGKIGLPHSSPYTMSKAALLGMSKTIALELAPRGVLVNSICPGAVQTPMIDRVTENKSAETAQYIPLGSLGDPKDIALFIFNISQSPYITGQDFIIDGGYLKGAH